MQSELNLQVYLHEIRRSPLLSAEDERELSRRVIRDNDRMAREHMVLSNLRLVVRIASNYRHRGLDLQDLIAEGNIGLVKAVDRFNPALNIRFSTYASWWIKQVIERAIIRCALPVHVPAQKVSLLGKWKRASVEAKDKLGRPPTPLEVSTHMSIPLKTLRTLEDADRAVQWRYQSPTNDDGATPVATLEDRQTATPESLAADREAIGLLHILLGKIDQRQAYVLRLHFGLDSEPLTLKEIGERLGLTRERVRQIQAEAFAELAKLVAEQRSREERDDGAAGDCDAMEEVSS